MLEYAPDWYNGFLWVVVVGFIVSFFVSFGMGANDVANAWGTSVGSGVLKLWQAYLLSAILDTLGAVLLGYKVTETIRHGIFDLDLYTIHSEYNATTQKYVQVDACSENGTECNTYTSGAYLVGELGVLVGAAVWLLLATVTKMPVSATQSIIGASIGMSLVFHGSKGIKWTNVLKIVISWLASPLLAGVFAATLYTAVKFGVMMHADPFTAALRSVPIFLCITLTVNLFSVFFNGSKYLGFNKIPWWGALVLAFGIGSIVALIFHFCFSNWIRRRAIRLYEEADVLKEASKSNLGSSTSMEFDAESASTLQLRRLIRPFPEEPRAQRVFNVLQTLSASFLSFSHGSNDTANAVAPLIGIWLVYKYGDADRDASGMAVMQAILLFGAFSMVAGLCALGHRVIRTMGTEITEVSAPSGFAVELGTAATVLFASKVGIPVSTTHCAVGAIIMVGLCKSSLEGVSWSRLRGIVLAWLVTIPVAAGVAAFVAYLLGHFAIGFV